MKKTQSVYCNVLDLCAETGPEDGIDPRYLKKDTCDKKFHQKTSRLCSEVTKVLSLVLAGDMRSPVLQTLQVVNVSAQSETQYLNVSVGYYVNDKEVEEQQVIYELKQAQGYLRAAISQRINRKRVPALSFTYVGLIK